jgi:hypothetical protein
MAQHKLGDIIDIDGVKGMVFKVDETGEHGLAMSIVRCGEPWLTDKDAKFETGAFYEDDGEKNMKAIERYIDEQSQQWEDFPFINWCRQLGDGWYAPAVEELETLIHFINGEGMKYNAKVTKKLSEALKKAGGDKLYKVGGFFYYSSTEAENGLVYGVIFDSGGANLVANASPLRLITGMKAVYKTGTYMKALPGGKMLANYGSRAVHKF